MSGKRSHPKRELEEIVFLRGLLKEKLCCYLSKKAGVPITKTATTLKI